MRSGSSGPVRLASVAPYVSDIYFGLALLTAQCLILVTPHWISVDAIVWVVETSALAGLYRAINT